MRPQWPARPVNQGRVRSRTSQRGWDTRGTHLTARWAQAAGTRRVYGRAYWPHGGTGPADGRYRGRRGDPDRAGAGPGGTDDAGEAGLEPDPAGRGGGHDP